MSFARGELSPSLQTRVDLPDYQMGLATCRNAYIERAGGWTNRPGLSWVCETKNSSLAARLIKFVFNDDQTYILEFGNLYMRVVKNGAQVLRGGFAVSAITKASPAHVTTAAHGYADGDEVHISGVLGMTEINGRNFKIDVTSATEFDLYEMDGTTAFNSSAFGAYTSGGTSQKVFEIVTPYVTADLSKIDAKAQSADVIVVTCAGYAQQKLSRLSDSSWTLVAITYGPDQIAPNGVTATVGAAGTAIIKYRVTAVNDETGDESLPARGAAQDISNITQANPAVVTYVGADSFANDDEIFITGVIGMTQVNDLKFTVAGLNAGANTFQLSGVDSTGYTAYGSAGTVALTYARINNAARTDAAAGHQIAIPIVAGASSYNVYQCFANTNGGGEFGFLGIARKTGTPASGTIIFYDIGRANDEFDTPPEDPNLFKVAGDFPATSCFYQQRLVNAGSSNEPNVFNASRIGLIYNFTRSTPIQDDDAIRAKLPGSGPNRILHALDIGTLVCFQDGSEWAVLGGGQNGTLTPSEINPRQYSFNGIASLRPLVVNRTALYVQARGNKVRDLMYDFQSNGYDGTELSLKSAHLLDGFTIVDWDYQHNPHSIIWAVRNDGTLLGLTYVRDQEVVAWHRHDTDGTFENVCCVPEDKEDSAYFVVKRTIGGKTKRYIERMDSRQWDDVADAKHLDCSISYDGRNPSAANTVTVNAAGTFAVFAVSIDSAQVGNELHVRGADGAIVKCTIGAVAGPPLTFAIIADRTVPASIAGVALADWSYAVNRVTGAWHIEGKEVGIFADGFVVGSPNNTSVDSFTVTNGAVTLPAYFAVIHIGLPYISSLKTLNLDRYGNTLANKAKLINGVLLWLDDTRGIWVGGDLPDDATPTEGLQENNPRSTEGYDDPPALQTGVIEQAIEGSWGTNGQIGVSIIDPVPARILSVAPAGIIT